MKTTFILLAALCLLLSGCISGRPKSETYTDGMGNTTLIESDQEMCVQSCNDDFSRCSDMVGMQDNGGVHAPRGMFGASADCRTSLKDCLPRCKAR